MLMSVLHYLNIPLLQSPHIDIKSSIQASLSQDEEDTRQMGTDAVRVKDKLKSDDKKPEMQPASMQPRPAVARTRPRP